MILAAVAHRGTYADGKWTYTFKTSCVSFEYKALVGDWDFGEKVYPDFVNLKWESGENHVFPIQ